MIRTFKIKHNTDFSTELAIAKTIVSSIIATKHAEISAGLKSIQPTTKTYNTSGLKAAIVNALIRKYYGNKKLRSIKRNPKLAFNHGSGKLIYIRNSVLTLTTIKMKIDLSDMWFFIRYPGLRPLHVELDNTYIYLACEIPDPTQSQSQPEFYLGVDLNATGDLAVVCDADTGKVLKLGKEMLHQKHRMQSLRSKRQSGGKKKFATKDYNRTLDTCRKIAKQITMLAVELGKGINVEQLGISRKKGCRPLNRLLQSFPFRLLIQSIKNCAERYGVSVVEVRAQYTSQACSRCGCIGTKTSSNRITTKKYLCVNCGHTDHADSNAGFNISAIRKDEYVNAWAKCF